MIARPTLRSALRFVPRFALACLGMSAIALADGTRAGALQLALLDRGNSSPLRMPQALPNDVEGSLVHAIVGMRERGIKSAMQEIDGVLDKTPNFALGHMVKGDMLMAQAGKPVAFAANSAAPGGSVSNLQDEARVRLQRFLDAPRVENLPAPVLQLAPTQQHVLLVDTTRRMPSR